MKLKDSLPRCCVLSKSILNISILLLSCITLYAQSPGPLRVIFDTDMGPDYDDVGAITLLHAFEDKGEATVLATIASTKYEGVAAVLNVLNTYFKKPDLPIGVPRGKALELKDFQHWTDTLIAKYPHKINSNNEVPDAVSLYRRILSKQPDNSVTIITVGFLTNISNLLQSKADEYSPLSGVELIRKKVTKLVSMAGKFPSGSEFNVREDALASQYALSNFPKPVIFSGFEIGAKIKSGLPLIRNTAISDSPVKDVFRICIPLAEQDKEGRMSWDQTAVLVAIRGHEPFYKLKQGKIVVDEKGNNKWDDKAKGQFHLTENQSVSEVSGIINDLMMHRPK